MPRTARSSILNMIGAAEQVVKDFEDVLEAYDLTREQYHLLRTVKRFEARREAYSQREVTDAAPGHGDVSRMIDRLARKGLVVREPHPEDSRMMVPRLTSSGHSALKGIRRSLNKRKDHIEQLVRDIMGA